VSLRCRSETCASLLDRRGDGLLRAVAERVVTEVVRDFFEDLLLGGEELQEPFALAVQFLEAAPDLLKRVLPPCDGIYGGGRWMSSAIDATRLD
jgi:hypothetical protein